MSKIAAPSGAEISIKAKIIKKDGKVIDLGEICRRETRQPWWRKIKIFNKE